VSFAAHALYPVRMRALRLAAANLVLRVLRGAWSRAWSRSALTGIAALFAGALGLAVPAHAQLAGAGLSLGWQDCRTAPGTGSDNQNSGCTVSINDLPLLPALRLVTAVDSVIACELVIDVIVAATALPAWWQMQPGGCHGSPPGWGASLATAVSCPDPWQGQATALAAAWLTSFPGSTPDRGRLTAAVVAPPGTLARFEADVPLALCRLALRSDNSQTCSGCSIPGCLVFNSLLIRRLPGSSWEEATVTSEQVAGATKVRWQGGLGADCQAVPTRRSTWAEVKSLYR